MKKKNLKTLALLGITGGVMLATESGVVANDTHTQQFPVYLAASCGGGGDQGGCKGRKETAARDVNLGTSYDRTYWDRNSTPGQSAQDSYSGNQGYQYQDPGMASGGMGTGTISGSANGASGSQVAPGYGGNKQGNYGNPGYTGTQGGYGSYGNQNATGTQGGYGSSYYSPGTPSTTSPSPSTTGSYDSSGIDKSGISGSMFNSNSQQSNATKRSQMSK